MPEGHPASLVAGWVPAEGKWKRGSPEKI